MRIFAPIVVLLSLVGCSARPTPLLVADRCDKEYCNVGKRPFQKVDHLYR